jgi:hypothetical protein
VRLRVVEVEGTPEELARMPEVAALLGKSPAEGDMPRMPRVSDEEPEGEKPGWAVPKQIRDFIAIRAGGRTRAHVVQRFVGEVLAWGTTEAEIGTSQASGDGYGNYLRVYKRGPRYFGAFAYVTPGTAKVTFRLPWKRAGHMAHATKRNVREGTGYEVVVSLTDDAAYADAIELAKLALEDVSRA